MTRQESKLFRKGVSLLKEGKLLKAHTAWEAIWKTDRGNEREWIRGFIQLTGALLKLKMNQPGSSKYLIRKAMHNLGNGKEDRQIVSNATMDYLASLKTAMESETLCKKPEHEAQELGRHLLNDSVLGFGK